MKRIQKITPHLGFALAIMLFTFLGINQVNVAMGFYEHPFTEVLIVLQSILFFFNLFPLPENGKMKKSQRLFFSAVPCLFLLFTAGLSLFTLFGGDDTLYAGAFGQYFVFLSSVLALIASVVRTVRIYG